MKKLFGISLIAALAVSPMMAMADPTPSTGIDVDKSPAAYTGTAGQEPVAAAGPAFATVEADDTDRNMATGSYVKGAYNAAIKAVNTVYQIADSNKTTIGAEDSGVNAGKIQMKGQNTANDSSDDVYANTVAEAVQSLQTQLDTTNSTYATQAGVENTIDSLTYTTNGTVDVLAVWGSNAVTTNAITATTTASAADYAEPANP